MRRLALLMTLLTCLLVGCGGGAGGSSSAGPASAGGDASGAVAVPVPTATPAPTATPVPNPTPAATKGSIVGVLGQTATGRKVAALTSSHFSASVQGTPIRSGVNADGSFRLDDVPPGDQLVCLYSGQDGSGALVEVNVSVGVTCTLGVIVPQPAGAVSGTVTGPGGPLARAFVLAAPLIGPDELMHDVVNGRPVLVALTDAQGHYDIAGLPPGAYLVTVRAHGFIEASQTVTVVAGASAAADFTLEAAPPASSSVSGQITALQDGQPVGLRGALIGLRPALLPPPPQPGPGGPVEPPPPPTDPEDMSVTQVVLDLPPVPGPRPVPIDERPLLAITDADGNYAIEAVPAGEYVAFIFKEGFASVEKSIQVGADQQVTLSVTLTANTATISGQVSDASGPLEGAGVIALYGDPFAPPVGVIMPMIGDIMPPMDGAIPGETMPPGGGVMPMAHSSDPGVSTPAPPTAGGLATAPPVRHFAITDELGRYSLSVFPGDYRVVAFAPHHIDQSKTASVSAGATEVIDFLLDGR